MTITDYLLLGAFAVAVFYTGYRLFRGWLRTPSHEIESETRATVLKTDYLLRNQTGRFNQITH